MSIKPLSLNLSKMKKVAGDEHSSTFLHPSGHHMVIAHHGVSALQRKQLEKMPVQKMAEGGLPVVANVASNDDLGYIANRFASDPTAQQRAHDAAMASLPKTPQDEAGTPTMAPAEEPAPAPESVGGADAPAPSSLQPQATPTAESAMNPVDLQKSYNQGQQAIGEQQAVDTAKAKSVADIQAKDLEDRQALNKNFQQSSQEFLAHQNQFMKDYAADHINPKHYLESMSTGQQIATRIGLFLGGFSSAFTHQGNPALDALNKQIDRDIAAQESRKDQQKTILGANQALFHDQTIAANQTRVNMNDIYDHKIQLAAQQLGTPQAKANADAAHAHFAMENATLLQQNAMRSAALKGAGGGVDPAKLVPFLVPKEHQAKAFGEIEAAENTRKMAGSIMDSFEHAAKENTALKTGFGALRTPGTVYALHQSMQPTFKDLEGTVRQAAMDNTFKNITPVPGDSKYTVDTKRKALQEYLQSKMSAPTARGYGIDLGKFSSTAPMQPANPMEGKTATGADGSKIIMRGGKWVPLGK